MSTWTCIECFDTEVIDRAGAEIPCPYCPKRVRITGLSHGIGEHDHDPSHGADDRGRDHDAAAGTGEGPSRTGERRSWRASTYDPDRLVARPSGRLRRAHLYPAEPGDGCSLSRCSTSAAYRIGWADPGDEPTVTTPYCARHGEPHRKEAT